MVAVARSATPRSLSREGLRDQRVVSLRNWLHRAGPRFRAFVIPVGYAKLMISHTDDRCQENILPTLLLAGSGWHVNHDGSNQ